MERLPPWSLALLFPLLFIAIWLFVIRVIALAGWDHFARRFRTDVDAVTGLPKHGGQTGSTGSQYYRHCLDAWVGADALYLRPSGLYRLFHPPIRLRFAEMARVEPRASMRGEGVRIIMAGSDKPLSLYGPAGLAVLKHFERP